MTWYRIIAIITRYIKLGSLLSKYEQKNIIYLRNLLTYWRRKCFKIRLLSRSLKGLFSLKPLIWKPTLRHLYLYVYYVRKVNTFSVFRTFSHFRTVYELCWSIFPLYGLAHFLYYVYMLFGKDNWNLKSYIFTFSPIICEYTLWKAIFERFSNWKKMFFPNCIRMIRI